MNEIGYKDCEAIHEINTIFAKLTTLTVDELRQRVDEIKNTIRLYEDDKSDLLDEFLPEVYAIVKETARRLSYGNIIVTANHNDRLLAEEFDFVTICEDKAIYKNRWDVDGVTHTWNMVHYDEQLLGGIHLHYGRAIEMATGEGKTLVAILPVFLNALSGEGVHIMTVNDYLSKRDYQLTRPLYMFHGLTVDCLEFHNYQEYGRKQAYSSDITFGANSSFVFDYLFDHLAIDPKTCVQVNHNYAIIDELDSILIDDADEPHIVSGGMEYYDGDIYKKYINIVRELIDSDSKDKYLYQAEKLYHKAIFTTEGQAWLSQKIGIHDLFRINKTYEIKEFDKLPLEIRTQVFDNLRIQNVLTQLLHALTVYEKDVDYLIINNKIEIIDQNTGRIRENCRWEHGLHTAIEVKEDKSIRKERDGMAVISLKNYFKLYSKISGMSGTVYSVRDELKKVYSLKTIIVPPHLPVIREDHPLRVFKTKEAKDREILSNIITNHRAGRPSLVGTLSLKRADEIEKHLLDAGIKFSRLDARTTKNEAVVVAKAGIGNTITLSTSIAGRGTDIKPSEDALKNGGLSIIGCDLFGSIRTDLQLKGRAGRQGNPGSSTFYTSLEDDILVYLSEDEKIKLYDIVSQISSDEISCDEVRDYFKLAQSKREEVFREKRVETAMKDDIVDPHRAKFYHQRNKVLFDAEYAARLVDGIVGKDSEDNLKEVDNSLHSLYVPTRELVVRSKKNNLIRQKIQIPYSENKHPFAVELDVNLTLSSEEYFKNEFKRQNLLQIYDKFWKNFVIYMMQNLDKKEISELSHRYNQMMTSINSIIIQRMTRTVPTFSVEVSVDGIDNSDVKKATNKTKNNSPWRHKLKTGELCPCGSGILYHECHGKWNNTIPRRRR